VLNGAAVLVVEVEKPHQLAIVAGVVQFLVVAVAVVLDHLCLVLLNVGQVAALQLT
jgi:hypothetical protein